jgi:hypothetical protein
MIAYTYNPFTFEFVGTSHADLDQMQNGVYILPAHSTWIACPEYDREKMVGYFDVNKQEWKLQDIDSEPEVDLITKEQVDFLKKELEEAMAQKQAVLKKLGLTDMEIDLLLVKLPTQEQIDELVGTELPAEGLPSLKYTGK